MIDLDDSLSFLEGWIIEGDVKIRTVESEKVTEGLVRLLLPAAANNDLDSLPRDTIRDVSIVISSVGLIDLT